MITVEPAFFQVAPATSTAPMVVAEQDRSEDLPGISNTHCPVSSKLVLRVLLTCVDWVG